MEISCNKEIAHLKEVVKAVFGLDIASLNDKDTLSIQNKLEEFRKAFIERGFGEEAADERNKSWMKWQATDGFKELVRNRVVLYYHPPGQFWHHSDGSVYYADDVGGALIIVKPPLQPLTFTGPCGTFVTTGWAYSLSITLEELMHFRVRGLHCNRHQTCVMAACIKPETRLGCASCKAEFLQYLCEQGRYIEIRAAMFCDKHYQALEKIAC